MVGARQRSWGWLVAVAALSVALGATRGEIPRPPGPYVALRIDLYESSASADSESESTKPTGEQRGSGVVVGSSEPNQWLVLTNAHVVEADGAETQVVPRVFAGGEWRTGRVVAADAEADLALVSIAFPEPLRVAEVSPGPPSDRTKVETHGFAGGKKYIERASELRRDLPLGGGSLARAPRRYFIRTTFAPGESGGAVTMGDRLVALIHGNDRQAGWGICVDQPSIAEFLGPFLKEPEKAE